MNFSEPPRRKPDENILPMINVVFLLLIFFLISARLTAPEPFAVSLPSSLAEAEAMGDFSVFVAPDGQVSYADLRDDAALLALTAARAAHCRTVACDQTPPRLSVRADATMPAARLAGLLPQFAAAGFANVELVALPVVPE